MYPEGFVKCFLILFYVLAIQLDEVKSQAQVSFSGDWLQAAQDELNREIKLQQEMMKQHAADLWSLHTNQRPQPTTTETSPPKKVPDVPFAVITPATPTKPTTEAPAPPVYEQPPDNFIGVDLRRPEIPVRSQVLVRKIDGSWEPKKFNRGDVIFEDDFSSGPGIDKTKWSHEIKIPLTNGYGFATYQDSLNNSFVEDNMLHIKPTVLDEITVRSGSISLEGCTGENREECERTAQLHLILHPVQTALLTTKNTMSFKYGRIDIRAKLPVGDWIVPEITLEPKSTETYGKFSSGSIQLAFARGNKDLMYEVNNVGNDRLEMGVEIVGRIPKTRVITNMNPQGWGSGFHNYTLIWTPDNLKFQVDDIPGVALCPQGRKLYPTMGVEIDPSQKKIWDKGSNIAPFDQEFYLNIGLSVGGLKHFKDGSRRSDGTQKPWRDHQAKALLNFWEKRKEWLPSWQTNGGKDSELQIDYVKITAL